MSKLREFDLYDHEWGQIQLLRVIGDKSSPWGCLAPLQGTPWSNLVSVVSGEALSHAMHGWATPLMREIGPPPSARVQRLSNVDRWCIRYQDKACILAGKDCIAGKKTMECFEAPGLPPTVITEVRQVVLAIRDDRYTIVVEGTEFVA